MDLPGVLRFKRFSKYFPDVQANRAGLTLSRHTDEDGVVQPGVLAVTRGLELRGRAEIEIRCAVGPPAHRDEPAVADMDVHAVIGLDGIDRLDLRAAVLTVVQLVVGSAGKDLALHPGPLEGTAYDGNDRPGALGGLPHRIGTGTIHIQFDDEFQAGPFGIAGGRLLGGKAEPAQKCNE